MQNLGILVQNLGILLQNLGILVQGWLKSRNIGLGWLKSRNISICKAGLNLGILVYNKMG